MLPTKSAYGIKIKDLSNKLENNSKWIKNSRKWLYFINIKTFTYFCFVSFSWKEKQNHTTKKNFWHANKMKRANHKTKKKKNGNQKYLSKKLSSYEKQHLTNISFLKMLKFKINHLRNIAEATHNYSSNSKIIYGVLFPILIILSMMGIKMII